MPTVAKRGNITVHTENIFPIIKKSIYSDHEIFLRELISNGVDAIAKLKMAAYSSGQTFDPSTAAIEIAIDKENKTLSITDNGIGMTAEEVEKYINQVAFSSAEEFVEKFKESEETIIGHFGLGFYSSFMVANTVEIDTLSFQDDAEAVHWKCDGSTEFEISESERTERGTTITLTLMEEEEEYLEESRIRSIVKKYCDFMPHPINLNGERINQEKALWKQNPKDLTKEDYLEFYRYLHPFQDEPLLWVHLNTDYPFVVNGILYFPKLKPDVDVTKGQIKLFCNQVFVSDNCEEVIPQFLMPLRGVIDSTDIPLNVSRSYLQGDRTVRRIADYIAKKVAGELKGLYRSDLPEYIRCWQDLGTFVKFGSLNDDKFKKQVEDILIYRTTAELGTGEEESSDAVAVEVQTEEGDAWESTEETKEPKDENGFYYTTLKDYLERNKERHENRVFYCTDPASQATYVELHKSQGLEVLFLDSFIDTHFVGFLEREFTDVKFARVDSEIDDALLDKDQKDTEIVDPATNKTRSEQIKELFEGALDNSRINIKVEALKGEDPANTPPAMVLLPEAMRRIQDMTAMFENKASAFPEDHILLVNSSHPLIANLLNLQQGAIAVEGGDSPSAALSKALCNHIYDLALMAQKGFDADGMKSFVGRSNEVLTQLTQR